MAKSIINVGKEKLTIKNYTNITGMSPFHKRWQIRHITELGSSYDLNIYVKTFDACQTVRLWRKVDIKNNGYTIGVIDKKTYELVSKKLIGIHVISDKNMFIYVIDQILSDIQLWT
jgi:hypothetical protein